MKARIQPFTDDNGQIKYFLQTLIPSNCHDEINWVAGGIMNREEVKLLAEQIRGVV